MSCSAAGIAAMAAPIVGAAGAATGLGPASVFVSVFAAGLSRAAAAGPVRGAIAGAAPASAAGGSDAAGGLDAGGVVANAGAEAGSAGTSADVAAEETGVKTGADGRADRWDAAAGTTAVAGRGLCAADGAKVGVDVGAKAEEGDMAGAGAGARAGAGAGWDVVWAPAGDSVAAPIRSARVAAAMRTAEDPDPVCRSALSCKLVIALPLCFCGFLCSRCVCGMRCKNCQRWRGFFCKGIGDDASGRDAPAASVHAAGAGLLGSGLLGPGRAE
ncbi:hypothetical protein ASG03_04645 [Rhizobium sp. Leaf341]|nr:hypothetical protein ASG03_04645 [Rhizobium sp. Leaf341]